MTYGMPQDIRNDIIYLTNEVIQEKLDENIHLIIFQTGSAERN